MNWSSTNDKFNQKLSESGATSDSSDDEAGETPPTAKVTTTVKTPATPPPDDYEPGESKIMDARKYSNKLGEIRIIDAA